MKHFLPLVLAISLVISLSACGGGAENSGGGTPATDSMQPADSNAEAGTDTEAGSGMAAAAELADWELEYMGNYAVSGDESYTWAYISMSYTDTFTNKIMDSFKSYVAENFPNVELLTADGKHDASVQIGYAENYAAQGIDCLILNPTDSDGCISIIDIMKEADIPLVIVNTELNAEGGYFIGSNHYQSGALQAQWMINNYDDSQTVRLCYLRGTSGFTHSMLRGEGFFETLDNANYNYELLSDLEGNYYRDQAMQITEDWIISFQGDIDVIVGANDEMGMGAVEALQGAGITTTLCLGIDANDDAMQAVRDGKFGCTVFQNATGQAKWSAIAAYAACSTGSAQDFEIPYELVDASNLDRYTS